RRRPSRPLVAPLNKLRPRTKLPSRLKPLEKPLNRLRPPAELQSRPKQREKPANRPQPLSGPLRQRARRRKLHNRESSSVRRVARVGRGQRTALRGREGVGQNG